MAFDLRGWGVSLDAGCEDKISEGVELCPFLRNIGVTTSFAFSKMKFPVPTPVSFFDFPLFLFVLELMWGLDDRLPSAGPEVLIFRCLQFLFRSWFAR